MVPAEIAGVAVVGRLQPAADVVDVAAEERSRYCWSVDQQRRRILPRAGAVAAAVVGAADAAVMQMMNRKAVFPNC